MFVAYGETPDQLQYLQRRKGQSTRVMIFVIQFCHFQIYPEYEQLFDVLVVQIQTQSVIVIVPLECFRISSITSVQPCNAQMLILQPFLFLIVYSLKVFLSFAYNHAIS